MNQRRLILVTGMPGSGKTTLACIMSRSGYKVQTMGDIIRKLADERGLEPSPLNLGHVAEEIRRINGDSAVAERCVGKLRNEDSNFVVVDGIRSLKEVQVFKEEIEDSTLIAIHASPKTRLSRLKDRGRSDYPKDLKTFKERDERELEFGVGSAIAMSDYLLINEGSINDLECSLRDLMERINEAWLK